MPKTVLMQDYQTNIDKLRAKSEASYIFACQAAVPLVVTTDLLYQLWNNFKQYQYSFEANEYYKISHIAVSDFLLSAFCKEVGVGLFEIEKKARDILLLDLEFLLGEKRKKTVAAFLEDYALLDYKYTHRKNLKDIHLLTALSILDPSEMEKQIIERINSASTDAEKINYLLVHRNLLPIGFESDLAEISRNMEGDSLSPILIEEESPEAAGVLNVNLPAELQSRITRLPSKKNNEGDDLKDNNLALQRIRECIRDPSIKVLDLGNCGLTDADFVVDGPVDAALRRCFHLETLNFNNETDLLSKTIDLKRNSLTSIPDAVLQLTNLRSLRFGYNNISSISGLSLLTNLKLLELNNNNLTEFSTLSELAHLNTLDLSNNAITNISALSSLESLRTLILSNNAIKRIAPLSKLTNLNCLYLNGNSIDDISPLSKLTRLDTLNLRNNKIADISGISQLRSLRHLDLGVNLVANIEPILDFLRNGQMGIVWYENDEFMSVGEINFFGNPITSPPVDVIMNGSHAVLSFFENVKRSKKRDTPTKYSPIIALLFDIVRDIDSELLHAARLYFAQENIPIIFIDPTSEDAANALKKADAVLLFYGKTDPNWFAYQQSELFKAGYNNSSKCGVIVADPEVTQKIRRDIHKSFTSIITEDNLSAQLDEFVEKLNIYLKKNSREEYKNDIFISYSFNELIDTWVRKQFLPLLNNYLSFEIDRSVTIHVENGRRDFGEKAEEIDKDLTRSKIYMPLISQSFFQNKRCLSELIVFLERSESTKANLVAPVILQKTENKLIGHIQQMDMSPYISLTTTQNSYRYAEFEENIRYLSRSLSSVIVNAPSINAPWPSPEDPDVAKRISFFSNSNNQLGWYDINSSAKDAVVSVEEIIDSLSVHVYKDELDKIQTDRKDEAKNEQVAFNYFISGDSFYLDKIEEVQYVRNHSSFHEFSSNTYVSSRDRISKFRYKGYQWGFIKSVYLKIVLKNGTESKKILKDIIYDN